MTKSRSMSLREIQTLVTKMDKNITPEDESFKAAVVFLTAVFHGTTNTKYLSRVTQYPLSLVRKFAFNARRNSIWDRRGTTHANWADDGLSFWLDVNVALGFMDRV